MVFYVKNTSVGLRIGEKRLAQTLPDGKTADEERWHPEYAKTHLVQLRQI